MCRIQRTAPTSFVYRVSCSTLLLMMLIGIMALANAGTIKAASAQADSASAVGGCPLFPANNIWNADISALPVHPNSANFITSIGATGHMHADFGAGLYNGAPIGIPYVVVPGNQQPARVSFTYSGESDAGPYPIPRNASIEGGAQSSGDRHVLVVNSGTCRLYETFASYPQADGSWKAGSGAIWDLRSNALRPRTWTSADAAGLPILPGLARYDEVAAGVIKHALRFTVNSTQKAFIWPARHFAAASTNPNLPPMGLRLRLKASVNVAAYPPQSRVVLTALQHYGMIVADNGSSWFVSGAPDDRWNNDDLAQLKNIHGSDFEVVDESRLQASPNSAQALLTIKPTVPATPTPPPDVHAKVVIATAAVPVSTQIEDRKNLLPNRSNNNDGWTKELLLPLVVAGGVLVLVGIVWNSRKRVVRPRKSVE